MRNETFFDAVRKVPFGGRLSAAQVRGMEAILRYAMAAGTLKTHLAYMLATTFHETAAHMQPIIETRQPNEKSNPSVKTAIARLDKAFAAGRLTWVKTPYWRLDANGKSWLGRGLVQLTHERNYKVLGERLDIDLVGDPDLALQMGIAISIMFEGMTHGLFTGRALSDYLHDNVADYRSARRVINSLESADKVAGYALQFEAALSAAGYAPVPAIAPRPKPPAPDVAPTPIPAPKPVAVPTEKLDPENLDKSLLKSKTVWQWLMTAVLAPLLTAITNPYVQALIVIIIAGFAIYAIKRRADIAKVYRGLKEEIGA